MEKLKILEPIFSQKLTLFYYENQLSSHISMLILFFRKI